MLGDMSTSVTVGTSGIQHLENVLRDGMLDLPPDAAVPGAEQSVCEG